MNLLFGFKQNRYLLLCKIDYGSTRTFSTLKLCCSKLAEIQEADIEECPQLNKTWGNDSDSDKELFKDLPFKSKIVNKIRSKLLPKSDQEPEIEVEKVSVPLKELEEMANKADKFAALDVLTVTFLIENFQNLNNSLLGQLEWSH